MPNTRVAGYALEHADAILSHLGKPIGIPSYRLPRDLIRAGARFDHCQQIGSYAPDFSNTVYRAEFSVPQRVFTQLAERRNAWPIPYTLIRSGIRSLQAEEPVPVGHRVTEVVMVSYGESRRAGWCPNRRAVP